MLGRLSLGSDFALMCAAKRTVPTMSFFTSILLTIAAFIASAVQFEWLEKLSARADRLPWLPRRFVHAFIAIVKAAQSALRLLRSAPMLLAHAFRRTSGALIRLFMFLTACVAALTESNQSRLQHALQKLKHDQTASAAKEHADEAVEYTAEEVRTIVREARR